MTWIVERTFAWLGRSRRLSKDYERLVQTSETMIDIATVRMVIKKLAPNWAFPHKLYIHGLRFFYRVTLDRKDTDFCTPLAKESTRLPAILSPDEVHRTLDAAVNCCDRTHFLIMYQPRPSIFFLWFAQVRMI